MFKIIYVLKCRNVCYDYLLLMKVSDKKAQNLNFCLRQNLKNEVFLVKKF